MGVPACNFRRGSISARPMADVLSDLRTADHTMRMMESASCSSPRTLTKPITEEDVEGIQARLDQRAKEQGNPDGAPRVPANERQRMERLRDYAIDAADQDPLDNLVQMVSATFETPIALISIVDLERQWFKAKVGLDASETPREMSFCAHAINNPEELFVVGDTTKDFRFKNNPLVLGNPNIRFYAGIPLVSPDGYAFGTLCAIDSKPRSCTRHQMDVLELLGKQVMTELNLRYYVSILKDSVATADNLLCNILPNAVVPRLKGGEMIADDIPCATVLFADLKGFTEYSSTVSAKELVLQLGKLFQAIDNLSLESQVCKIKTIGDCYMAAAGVPEPCSPVEHGQCIVNFAFGILDLLKEHNEQNGTNLEMRIGIAAGPVTAGVVGSIRFHYDLWGSTVNLASRIESTGIPGHICINEELYGYLKALPEAPFTFEDRGEIPMKGLGPTRVYLVREA